MAETILTDDVVDTLDAVDHHGHDLRVCVEQVHKGHSRLRLLRRDGDEGGENCKLLRRAHAARNLEQIHRETGLLARGRLAAELRGLEAAKGDMVADQLFGGDIGIRRSIGIDIALTDCPHCRCMITQSFVNQDCGNVMQAWRKMGELEPHSELELQTLRAYSTPGLTRELRQITDGTLHLQPTLAPHEIWCIELEFLE